MLAQHHTTTIAPLFGQQTPDANGNLEWTDPGFWGRDASTLRNALGECFLPRTPRTQYSGLLGEAPATMSDADLHARWNTHNSGPDVPR